MRKNKDKNLYKLSSISIRFPSLIVFKYLFKRSLRHKSYQLFVLCLLISSLIMGLIGFFSAGVQKSLNEDISKFLGAPLVVSTSLPLEQNWWQNIANTLKIDATTTASFTYGVIGKSGYHSIGLKAVSKNYPLNDSIKLLVNSPINEPKQFLVSANSLHSMDAWLDKRAMVELGLKQGDKIQVGKQFFNVVGEIIFEPDRLTQLQHMLPRVMIRLSDLETTGIDIKNGRGDFRYLFDEEPEQLELIESSLPSLVNQPYQILKANEGAHPFSRIAQRSEKMLSLVMVLIMLMCGSAAALVADFAMKQFVFPATILRCLGLKKKSITASMMIQLSLFAIICSVIGTYIAWLMQPLIGGLLEPHLVIQQNVFDFRTPIITLCINALIIIAFVYPRLKAIGSVPITSVLRNNLNIKKSLWISTFASALSVTLLLWYFSDNTTLTVILTTGVVVLLVLSIGFGWIISQFTTQFHRLSRGLLKVVLRSIGRNPKKNIAPMATIALSVMGFLMINTLRTSFIDSYQISSLNQDGNLLFSRLPSEQKDPFNAFISNNNLTLKGLYPTVSAKLESINGVPVDKALNQESDTREEIRSAVRLSWSRHLPENNRMLEGKWPQNAKDGVSVESEVMSDLGLSIGDELTFRINDKQFKTSISSRREFKSGSSRMMFWFMFAPNVLNQFDPQYMGGIHMNQAQLPDNNTVLSDLNVQFPQVLFSDLQQLVNRISAIMQALMNIMSAILFILLCGAFTVLIVSAFVGSHDNGHTIMRSLGVTKTQLIKMNVLQQGLIGLVSCLVGILGAQLISGILFEELFSIPYKADMTQNVLITVLTTLSFIIFGLLMSYNNLKKPILINQMNHS